MKEQHYKQVWIESEKDLPKKEGYYFIKINAGDKYEKGSFGDIEKFDPNDEDDRFSWLHSVDYYLAEVKQPKGLTDEEIEKEALNHCAYQGQPERTDENLIIKIRRILVDYHRRDDYDLTKAENDMLCLFRNTFVSLKSQPEKEQPSDEDIIRYAKESYYPNESSKINAYISGVRDALKGRIPITDKK